MNTLRARLALLLLGAIVSVLLLVTAAVLYTFKPNSDDQIIGPLARETALIMQFAEYGAPQSAFSASPPQLDLDEELTRELRSGLGRLGVSRDVVVGRSMNSTSVIAASFGPNGWLTVPAPALPPREGLWRLFLSWIVAIAFGIGAIAVFAAHRMTRPIQVVESMVANIGDEGRLPMLPEDGPAEVRAVARAMNRLSARLQAAMDSRMRLVAAAGHDLRTPITRLRLRAEFVGEEDREAFMRDLDELENIADSAIALVRLETTDEASEPVELNGLISEIVEELQMQGLAASWIEAGPVYAKAARIALKRALRNVIINACTHGGGASVALEAAKEDALITVLDSGPGIPYDLMGRVFEPFFRVDPARRKEIPGAGLGLSIANEIVMRAGGSLDVRNREDGGLCQTIRIPTMPAMPGQSTE
jgi:signal transduction histidine kinase